MQEKLKIVFAHSLKKNFIVVNATWISASVKCLKQAANTGFNIIL